MLVVFTILKYTTTTSVELRREMTAKQTYMVGVMEDKLTFRTFTSTKTVRVSSAASHAFWRLLLLPLFFILKHQLCSLPPSWKSLKGNADNMKGLFTLSTATSMKTSLLLALTCLRIIPRLIERGCVLGHIAEARQIASTYHQKK